MIDLTKNQIVDPPVKCRYKDDTRDWNTDGMLYSIDHREAFPYRIEPKDNAIEWWEHCELTPEKTIRYMTREEVQDFIYDEVFEHRKIMVKIKESIRWDFAIKMPLSPINCYHFCYLENGKYTESQDFMVADEI